MGKFALIFKCFGLQTCFQNKLCLLSTVLLYRNWLGSPDHIGQKNLMGHYLPATRIGDLIVWFTLKLQARKQSHGVQSCIKSLVQKAKNLEFYWQSTGESIGPSSSSRKKKSIFLVSILLSMWATPQKIEWCQPMLRKADLLYLAANSDTNLWNTSQAYPERMLSEPSVQPWPKINHRATEVFLYVLP